MRNKKYMFFSYTLLVILTTLYVVYQSHTKFLASLKLNYVKVLKTETETKNNTIKNHGDCPNGTILYTVDGGNTGNKIWEYLSVLAVYKVFPEKQFIPYIPDSILKHLEGIYEPLSLPPLSKLAVECRYFNESKIIRNSDKYPVIEKLPNGTKSVQIATCASRYQEVIRFGVDKVRQELRYKPANVKIAMETFAELKKTFLIPSDVNPIYVGIHFRGTDYTTYFKKRFKKYFKGPPTYEYYSRAMAYFTEKYEHVIFILISIDYKWIKNNVKQLKGNLVVNPYKNNKIQDMALLSHCNHSIINYGTFGVTVAMLAGGTTIIYNITLPPNESTLATGYAKLVDNWILMK